ncbi:Zinc finger C2H2-type [Sesbania bispinosa]|nr:Zinc finger C2H2-type [Sesbania bispinosa]
MMSEEALSAVPSKLLVQPHDHPNSSNPNPNSNSVKRKRNPDAEVIALSPKSLMATNRFVCEVCNKGFQRDQNLQLHRRGHNLPWKLRQRTNQEVKKKVYVCPEKSCVHHDPCRALGDLTGIKKHFSRKHGEKKWKCEKCSKKYAVQSDWKAHSKICGTREYRCDCGTLFSRKDSFLTHRAFCDALAERSARLTSIPLVLSNFGNDPLMMNAQAVPRNISQSLFGFQHELDGSGPESFMGNFVDYGQKRVSQWNNNPQLHQNQNTTHHMSATALLHKAAQMESGRINGNTTFNNNNNVFGLLSSNLSSNNNRNSTSIGEIQKFFKEENQGENLNYINQSIMDMEKQVYSGSNSEDQLSLTRDFLGVGDDSSLNRPFLQQEFSAKFNPMEQVDVMNLQGQFSGHY